MIEEKDVMVPTRDGARIALRIYRPEGKGPFPVLYAASAYRYDNDEAAYTPLFPWRETGPVEWYVEQGYAYAHADVRGAGRSEGEYGFLDRKEQEAHYDVIEWLGAQPWSNGKIGSIGQSYYCMSQWFMAAQNPPHLACVGAYDGLTDLYNFFGYTGGIEKSYLSFWYGLAVRTPNQFPANGGHPRLMSQDIPGEAMSHPLYDDYWRERSAKEQVHKIKVPVYSIGVWAKQELHLAGNIDGFQKAQGPKKLYLCGTPTSTTAQTDFASIAFHEEFMLPFYDHYLKGSNTSYLERPVVQYDVRHGKRKASKSWPPEGVQTKRLFLQGGPSGSVRSLNDGSLSEQKASGIDATSYSYPDPGWTVGLGTATLKPGAAPDTVGRVLTFTSRPLDQAIELAGNATLVLYFSSTADDTDFIVKVSEQLPRSEVDIAAGLQPGFEVVTKGWLRASIATAEKEEAASDWPVYSYSKREALVPGQVYRIAIPMQAMAYRFRARSAIRLEIANHDSPVTERQFAHVYKPSKHGTDTLYHSAKHPSQLLMQANMDT